MHHMRGSRKQKQSLNNFHLLARRSFLTSSRGSRRSVFRPGVLLVGLTATAGLSSLAIAMHQQNSQVKSQFISISTRSDLELPPINDLSTANITVDAVSNDSSQSAANSGPGNNSAQVTINNETVPLDENGTIHRSYNNENGSMDVDISIHSTASDDSNRNSSTRIDIDSTSHSRTRTNIHNVSRGSPGN
jgi:cytoskeletal protein RodZ